MKTYYFLAALLLNMFLINNFSFAQNEIEIYELPKLIEGSNLYVNASPYYQNDIINDTNKTNYLSIGLGLDFVKWRYTPKLDYSVRIKPSFSNNRVSINDFQIDTVFANSRGLLFIEGGISYYPFKKAVYGGFYFVSDARFSNSSKPSSNNDFYAYAGFGRLINAGQVIFTKNFEKALLDYGVISRKLSRDVLGELTELLDKRYYREFISKYKDDADIEFFSQIEQFLIDKKIINSRLGSSAVLKLFQILTNSSFVNYPRYKGFLTQAEINYNNIAFDYEGKYSNTVSLNLSGLYGIPIGLNTDLLFSAYISLPLNKNSKNLLDYPVYHSPITLREAFPLYSPYVNDLNINGIYDYIAGAKIIAFHNFSNTIGISGFLSYNYGKTGGEKNDYTGNSVVQLRYNILSRLMMNTNIQYFTTQAHKLYFSSSIDLSYIIF